MMIFDFLIEISGMLLLFLLVFGMSATVDIAHLQSQVKNRKAIFCGCFLQFIILPLIGFATVKILDLNETMGITLLVVTSSPGGSYSNWWCSMFNADLALSVTMTAISTVLSIITLPLNLVMYSRLTYDDDVVSQLNWGSLLTSLVVVMGAIAIGLVCSARVHSHRFNKVANKLGNVAGILLVVFSAVISSRGEGDSKIWNRSWHFYVGIALPCIFGLVIANIFTKSLRLIPPERVTVSIECCYQNVGIATSVALTMFEGNDLAEAMGVPLYYGLVEAVVLGIYCTIAWKIGWTKAPPEVPFYTMIIESYEVIFAEKKEIESVEVLLRTTKDGQEKLSQNGDSLIAYYKFEDIGAADSYQKFGDKLADTIGMLQLNKELKEPSGLQELNILAQKEEENQTDVCKTDVKV